MIQKPEFPFSSSDHHPVRIAFSNLEGKIWPAGVYYLRNLLMALHSLSKGLRPETDLLIPSNAESVDFEGLKTYVDHLLVTPAAVPDQSTILKRLMKRALKWVKISQESEVLLSSYLRHQGVDCIFSKGEYGPQFRVPLLSWIPDFQHLRMPEMFSNEEIIKRNRLFSQVATNATRVILSSEDALHDFETYYPQSVYKARVLPFVANIPVNTFDMKSDWVNKYYCLPEKFFYLPNQFWKHKNHGVVVQALAIIKSQYPEIVVVCSGATSELRHPLYFAELLATISHLGLRDNFIILGFIPREHIFHLMRQSIAVLQPSLFEGWSTSVEEVKSLGKSLVISDIAVHREQDPPSAVYFDPNEPNDLASSLIEVFKTHASGPNIDMEALAREQLQRRTSDFGGRFIEIVNEVLSE